MFYKQFSSLNSINIFKVHLENSNAISVSNICIINNIQGGRQKQNGSFKGIQSHNIRNLIANSISKIKAARVQVCTFRFLSVIKR